MQRVILSAVAFSVGFSTLLTTQPLVLSASAETPSTLPDVYVGLSARDARALRGELARLTAERDVREDTLMAIAARLRVDYSETSFATLLEALDDRAREAEELRFELAKLETRFRVIPARANRDEAQALLSRARSAFDAGDLDEADRLLAELTPLRGQELLIGVENWQQAVEARAKVMVVSGRVKESVSYRREASQTLAELTRQVQFEMMLRAARDAHNEGERLPGLDMLQLAIETYVLDVLPLAPPVVAPADWAITQVNLGSAYARQGERTGGPEGVALIARAVTAYVAALAVYTQEATPADWAMTQSNLGNAFLRQGERMGGPEGAALIARAVTANETALTVYTQEAMPADWARTHMNLGSAYLSQGERTGGPEGAALIARAATAYEAALTVYTQEAMPADWAKTQMSLGSAYARQGERSGELEGAALLARAITAYEAALQVYTQEATPADWAMTQVNLGIAYARQGGRSGGAEGAALLARAITAYEAALQVYTQEVTPVDWAMTQVNLGNAYLSQGERTGGPEGAALFARAITVYEAALTVYTKEAMPANWATTQVNHGNAYMRQGENTGGPKGAALLARAVTAYEAALTVYGEDHYYSESIMRSRDRAKEALAQN